MIPSRPLKLVDIISETFSIYGRTLLRYSLLFVILFLPGTILVTIGSLEFARDSVASAEHAIGFNDSALTTMRNDASAWLASQNPLFAAEWPVRDTVVVPHPTTRAFAHFIGTQVTDFAGPLNFLGIGALLFIFGIFALGSATIDLASQRFEERPLEVWEALRISTARHGWRMLFLYLCWVVINWILDTILLLLPGQVGGALAGFVTGAQLYILIRLAVVFPALVSEELGPFAAVRRSWELTKRTAWKVLGAAVAFGILFFLAVILVSMVLSIFSGTAMNGLNDFFSLPHLTLGWYYSHAPSFLEAIAIEMSIGALILFSLLPIFLTVLYYDLRTRHDGPLVYLDHS